MAWTINDIRSVGGGKIVDPDTYRSRQVSIEKMRASLGGSSVMGRDSSAVLVEQKLKSYEKSLPLPIPDNELDSAIALRKELLGRWAGHKRQVTQEVEQGKMRNGEQIFSSLHSPSGVFKDGRELKLKELEDLVQQAGYQLFFKTGDKMFLRYREARPKEGLLPGTEAKEKKIMVSGVELPSRTEEVEEKPKRKRRTKAEIEAEKQEEVGVASESDKGL